MMSPSRNTPTVPQTISTGRLASTRPIPPGSGRQVGFWRRGSGHRTASATNETTSTMAAAQPNNHSGIGRSDRTEIPCPIRNKWASRRFDYEGSDHGSPAGVLGHVALDLELAFDGGLERETRGLPGRGLLHDVVAVQVNLVGRVGAHHDRHGVTVLDLDIWGPTHRLAATDLDSADLGLRRSRRLGVSLGLGLGAGLGLRGRGGLSRVVALVIPAGARDHERQHG